MERVLEDLAWNFEQFIAKRSPRAALWSARREARIWAWGRARRLAKPALECKDPDDLAEARMLLAISDWEWLSVPTEDELRQTRREVVSTLREVADSGHAEHAPLALYWLAEVYLNPKEPRGGVADAPDVQSALACYDQAGEFTGMFAESSVKRAKNLRDPRVTVLTLYFENPVTGDRVAADAAAIAATLTKMGRQELIGLPYWGHPTEDGYEVEIFNHL